ncbi:bifunctional glutamate N-acetyltransferase/amino-acid acetyltransferase ArgJ [Lentisphaerota bacterium ZTH]|nr:bifunctional glutamate N-acetyltransferase/amino-acid acetyltransferase ArgJ [Lentisphaerota bacterium]WET06200.1 bifunctional glutamate N-acetyltransferase/amino-acid acetyltransferase ArgJ [Lentisphaerota bacterium ZTH]
MQQTHKFITYGSVTSPRGFTASGIAAGLKYSGKPDMGLIFSEVPAKVSGAFTTCVFAAAPVQVCKQRVLENESARAVIINSGNANACTGNPGLDAAHEMCSYTAEKLGIRAEDVLVSSTGRIGVQLPMDTIKSGIDKAVAARSSEGGNDLAQAIMTTDTVPKSAAVEVELSNGKVTIGAAVKGSGMIDPYMQVPHATMLCYITTDAGLEKKQLDDMLYSGINQSFNRITIDGDMSTNDTTIIMANGVSGVQVQDKDAAVFSAALQALMQQLAREMVIDGEGATKFVEVNISNAATEADARCLAEAIGNSLLCKTAWFGNDPNWGRLVAALGYSGVKFDPDLVDVCYDDMPVVSKGGDAGTPEEELAEVLKKSDFKVNVNMNAGSAGYWIWTCDISYEYVKINAEYHT